MTPRIGSLCSGYGGLDLAVEQALDAETTWVCEYDKHASRILEQRFAVPNHGDITTVDWTAVEPVDVVTAGYPCQPFSHAGKRKGAADERHIWPHVCDAVRVLRPGLVVLENVAGHLSLGFGRVLGDLVEIGYDARWTSLRAADVGAPHGRLRVFILATPDADAGQPNQQQSSDRQTDQWTTEGRTELRARGRHRTPADAADLGRQRGRSTRDGWAGPADGAPADADCSGREARDGRQGTRNARRRESVVGGDKPRTDRGTAPTDATVSNGWQLLRQSEESSAGARGDVAWGIYEPAIRRWEALTRPAPPPTSTGRSGPRLSLLFVEWLMGLPAGWVTDVDIPRNAQLKALGNGVVPQQAYAAVRHLLDLGQVAA